MIELPENKKIILYDGVCFFCNGWILKIIAKDNKDVFRFAALQSEEGKAVLQYIGIPNHDLNSVVLYIPGVAYYTKMNAIARIGKEIGGLFSLLSLVTILPKSMQKYLYNYVARNRYLWFGKSETCLLPPKEIITKFL